MSHFGQKLPYTGTPFGHRNIMQTDINEPKEGDYLCIKKNGEDWPIVICDEEIIQTFFTQPPRPRSARRADGTWEKDYKAGGFLISDRRFPAINLGTMELTWTSSKEFEPIDIDMGRAIRSSTMNPLLAKAWSEYIAQYKGDKIHEWKYLDHWKTRLQAGTPTGGSKRQKLPVGKDLKRKGTPNFKYPPGYRNEEVDDEESDDLFLPKGNTAGPKIKRESINSFSSEEIDALYDDADPPYPTSSQSSKRSKLDLSGRFSMRPSTPSRAGPGKLATPVPSARRGTPSQSTNQKIDVNESNTVIIYVDNPHKRFRVKRGGLDTSPLLSKLLTHRPEDGWYIMSPMLSSIDANDFQPVGEYIDRREYHPNILDDGTVHVRLEGDLSPEMLRFQVVRCGTIYQTATMLEMPGLQHLAFQKLKALSPHYRPLEILTVTELLFGIGGQQICQHLTQHVADHFWNLVLTETEKTAEVMGANEGLAKGVFRMLSGLDDKVKMEKKVKEEGKEETLGESKEGGKKVGEGTVGKTDDEERQARQPMSKAKPDHDPNRKADSGIAANNIKGTVPPRADIDAAGNDDENKAKGNNEGLSQAEKDMLRTALRQASDDDEEEETSAANEGAGLGYAEEEAKTEDDWVRLVQKQSDLFEAF